MMPKWYNWLCLAIFVLSMIVVLLSGVPFWIALVSELELVFSIWVSAQVTFISIKWLSNKFVLFRQPIVGLFTVIVVSVTVYSLLMQLLYFIVGNGA